MVKPQQCSVATFRAMLDNNRPEQLLQWSASFEASFMDHWELLHRAWVSSARPEVLSWDLLSRCITIAKDTVQAGPLLILETFASGRGAAGRSWLQSLDEVTAHRCMEQAVAWRLQAPKADSFAAQCLDTESLMHASMVCNQGRIWREHFELYTYPLIPENVMRRAEEAKCTDAAVYNAIWAYQQNDTTKAGWKRACLEKNQPHNLRQISASPFVSTEYILDQHAQYDNRETYSQIAERSHFSDIWVTDQWMVEQLIRPASNWDAAGCPEPGNRTIQTWWYSLLLGSSDGALLELLTLNAPIQDQVLPLPNGMLMEP